LTYRGPQLSGRGPQTAAAAAAAAVTDFLQAKCDFTRKMAVLHF